MIRKTLCAALLLVACHSKAQADPDRISLLLGSHHVDAKAQFEGRNPGVFLTWEDRGGLDWSLGAYRNSYGRNSVAATVALPVVIGRDAELALFAGAALYPGDGRDFAMQWGDLVPLVGLQLRAGHLFVQVIPSDGAATDAIISFGLTKLISK